MAEQFIEQNEQYPDQSPSISRGECMAVRLTKILNMSDYHVEQTVEDFAVTRGIDGSMDVFDCRTCNKAVSFQDSRVEAQGCILSGSCEASIIETRPEQYIDKQGELTHAELPCANCSATIGLTAAKDGGIQTDITAGSCLVDINGAVYRDTGRTSMDKMPLVDTVRLYEQADTTGDENPDSISCTGFALTQSINGGDPVFPGDYSCPRSDRSGEHCERTLNADALGNIAVVIEGIPQEWQAHCLLRRKDYSKPVPDNTEDNSSDY